jgi:hypothetical protein
MAHFFVSMPALGDYFAGDHEVCLAGTAALKPVRRASRKERRGHGGAV